MEQGNRQWHRLTIDAVLQTLNTNAACGLTVKAARSRSKKEGANDLLAPPKEREPSLLKRLASEPSMWLFLFACFLNLCFLHVGRAVAALLIFLACLPILIIFHTGEKRLFFAKARARGPLVSVLREENLISIHAQSLVRGDILLLKKGDVVPCDCRILEGMDLQVATLTLNAQGKPIYCMLPKNGALVYPNDLDVKAPYCENMLYGGSVVEHGSVLAVAVETGDACFAAGFEQLGFMEERDEVALQKWEVRIKKSTHLYQILLYVFLTPLMLLGFFFSSKGTDLLSVFLTYTAVLFLSSQTLLLVRLRAIGKLGIIDALFSKKENLPILFASGRSVECLSLATDLFLFGRASVSDQKSRLTFLATASGRIDHSSAESASVDPLCEAFLFRNLANAASKADSVSRTEHGVCADLFQCGAFDREAAEVLFVSSKRVFSSDQLSSYAVKTRNESFTLHFYKSRVALDRSTLYKQDGTQYAMDDQKKSALQLLADEAETLTEYQEYVLKQDSFGCEFLGIVGSSQLPEPSLEQAFSELRVLSLKPKVFLFGDPSKELVFARTLETLSVCLKDGDENATLTPALLDAHDLFIGFSRRDALELVLQMKAEKRRIAAVALDHASVPLLQNADLAISYDSVVVASPLHRPPSVPTVDHLCDLARRRADVLVPSVSQSKGGVFAVLQALLKARSIVLKQSTAFRFLLLSQSFLLAILVYSVFTGLGLLPALAVLVAEWILSNLFLALLCAGTPKGKALTGRLLFSPARLIASLKKLRVWIFPAVLLLSTVLLDLIGIFSSVLDSTGHSVLLSVSLLLFYATCFFLHLFQKGFLLKK